MKELPLLLSTPMVQAYLALRKTATRRIPNCMNSFVDGKRVSGKKWKELNFDLKDYHIRDNMFFLMSKKEMRYHKIEPIYQPGDLLYFRETWFIVERAGQGVDERFLVFETEWNGNEVIESAPLRQLDKVYKWGGHPSIHLPKEATRLWAECTSCACERVQDITEEQAIAEGLARITKDDGITWKYGIPDKDGLPGNDDHGWPWHDWSVSARNAFATLWGRIHGLESWQANPPVYAINYKILSTTGKPLEKENV